ncbi:SMODS domain-containing nucleotidyltransferase [Pedococcus sp. 5OH_020]|uniref:SMODS domain-containing nucleotidyltransferase n=1 Tax=Pedococcus sp. 5OH_020 TaxID=2989814 RepID=UPI0022E9D0A0|nr:nucleotidyltransferase [Pedococcus sp. 5OH_020]
MTDFNALLENTVNLPDGKLDSLADRVDKIYAAIKAAKPDASVLSKKRQGSWAQRTIINPPKELEFDADFMLELEEVPGWSPAQYNNAVFQALDKDPVYGEMDKPVEAKNRCVRVSYANDMHVDVVPYVNRADEGEHIINAETDEWEASNSDEFTTWMKEKDDLADGNMRRVIRLLKYLRDHRGWYKDTVSIILTTVVGITIKPENVLADAKSYANVPVALGRIVSDLAEWVRENETLPEVEAGESAVFTHRWTETKYQQFRTEIQKLDTKISAALVQTDEDESLALWRELFGTGFAAADSDTKGSKFPAIGAGAAGGAGRDLLPVEAARLGDSKRAIATSAHQVATASAGRPARPGQRPA